MCFTFRFSHAVGSHGAFRGPQLRLFSTNLLFISAIAKTSWSSRERGFRTRCLSFRLFEVVKKAIISLSLIGLPKRSSIVNFASEFWIALVNPVLLIWLPFRTRRRNCASALLAMASAKDAIPTSEIRLQPRVSVFKFGSDPLLLHVACSQLCAHHQVGLDLVVACIIIKGLL